MYCVKCGVELAENQRSCPLCNTPVMYPGYPESDERTFPDNPPPVAVINAKGIYFIISFICLISAAISVFADINMGGGINWAGYVVGAVTLAYFVFLFPFWFVRPSPAIFVPVDFLVVGVYVWYISYATGGDWFFGFALPIVGGSALIVSAVAILCHYLRRGYLYIFGGAFILTGGFAVLIEWLIHIWFEPALHIIWSPYPAITFGLVGIMLIVIAIVKPLRESLYRIFAL